MHELGVLFQAVKTVDRLAEENKIQRVKHITLEVGDESGFIPKFFEKLFPVATDQFPRIQGAELRIELAKGRQLLIKDFGY